jgi:glutamate dehydrogenase/leucine dehydrogenase
LSNYPEYNGHEFVIFLSDVESGLDAVVAIHSRARGIAHGGTRVKQYDTEDGALRDALNLSRAMTNKSALADLPYGGAKGVISLPSGDYDKSKILEAYAKKVAALNGLFHTGTDVGLTDEEAVFMAEHCPYILGTKANPDGYTTSKTAALGVLHAMKAAAQFKYGSEDLTGKVVGVKGVGKLGAELVRLLRDEGARLIIADFNEESTTKLKQQYPDVTVMSAIEIAKTKLDIYAPCAMGSEFDETTVAALNCDIVCGGANNQLLNDEAGDMLFQKGILYTPDYIANAGGLIFICEDLESDGFKLERLLSRVQAIGKTLSLVFKLSDAQQLGTHRVADQIARERVLGVSNDIR